MCTRVVTHLAQPLLKSGGGGLALTGFTKERRMSVCIRILLFIILFFSFSYVLFLFSKKKKGPSIYTAALRTDRPWVCLACSSHTAKSKCASEQEKQKHSNVHTSSSPFMFVAFNFLHLTAQRGEKKMSSGDARL